MSAPAANPEKWRGPYLSKKIPVDPWGNPYMYRNPGTNAEFDVISLGADGKPGGAGDNADLTN
jgi:general secretion pathway protein G